MTFRHAAPSLWIALALSLGACSSSRPVDTSEYTSSSSQATGIDTTVGLAGEGGISFGTTGKRPEKQEGSEGGIGVNAYLWRATLDTLSFMPLVSADPLGGVIITDWWQPQTTPRERFKATAYILSRRLRSDGIKVSIFRQVEQGGQWTDMPVNATTRGEIEDKIIARAREMRAPFAGN